jgi:coenzyme F420-0:L-glutamate ligase/coenzyme F420-1:gamma-L-glutamate ligase
MNGALNPAVPALTVVPLRGLPLVEPGDDLIGLLVEALRAADVALRDQDVLVVTSKIVSKAEGRYVTLADVAPGAKALNYATTTGKDPRLVELVLGEAAEVLRHRPGTMVVAHRLGHVHANAGIDQSNIADSEARALLLPVDPDASARALKAGLDAAFAADIGVVIADSVGRAWRKGTIGTAIGVAGLPALMDLRGNPDLFGRELKISETGFADEIAATATMVMGQGAEGIPATVVRGLAWQGAPTGVAPLIRPIDQDMFR